MSSIVSYNNLAMRTKERGWHLPNERTKLRINSCNRLRRREW